jgi:hypothetical protein
MSYTYSPFTKLRIAAAADEPSRMCSAKGCPNPWSIEAGDGKLCGAHASAPSSEWPAVTQAEIWAQTDRARETPPEQVEQPLELTRSDAFELAERLDQLRQMLRNREPLQPLGWVAALRRREQAGEPLTLAQRQMWRAAASRLRP